MMRVPWPETMYAALVWGLSGAAGLVYTAFVGRQMIKQTAYRPGFEDWLFHVALPLASYALLGSAFFIEKANIIAALFAVAGCSLLLLLVGIHNAWDAVAYHVFVDIRGTHDEAARKNRTRKE